MTALHLNVDLSTGTIFQLRELEGETEKDVDCTLGSKPPFNWDSDEIQLDFVALKKSYEILFQLPSHVQFENCFLRALKLFAG